ncbi:MAG TPA: Na+/H+ antiporter [Actinophytocola sp.]|jgi:CPA1 family monovalent cation:H+ antiporter|uniref:Na+/H+ antiporter n=1 Tax=Actinophytocola sp. TaxID=1872138 RepID=UPI002DF9333A|nr:Na+/H+ antiporter [Actinophytocola sp.]
MRSVETVLFLVVVATVVATFARRLRVPAPTLLVIAGVIIGLVPGVPSIEVTPDVVSLIVLPPLLFAAGEELPWRDLRAVWRPVTTLAVGLVLATAAGVAAVAVALTPLPLGMAFVLGAVLASTDPVAVTALGRRLALPPRIQALVQAESLFNDATSLLLFRLAVGLVVAGGVADWGRTVTEFAVLAGGGVLAGAVVAAGAYVIRRRTEEPVLETVVSLVTPYAAYVAAESVHASGVTAVVVASIVLGTQAHRMTNAHLRLQLGAVNGTVIFLLESVVFGLIGLQLPALVRRLTGTDTVWPVQALAIAATLVVVRLLWVFPLSALAQRRSGVRRPSWQVPAVVSWAGARGVVPLAAALSIPLTTSGNAPLENRDLVLLLSIAVIVLTLVVQGLTLAPLVRLAGIALRPEDVRQEHTFARMRLAQAGLQHLDGVAETEAAPDFVVEQLRQSWEARAARAAAGDADEPDNSAALAYRGLRHELLAVEGAELTRLFESGAITDGTRRRIQRVLDLEQAGLGEDDL